jgi:hypothetical protein
MTMNEIKNGMMTVQELINRLSEIKNKDRVVVMAKDGEGNDYSPLYNFWEGRYEANTTWYGEVGLDALTKDLMEQGYTEDDVGSGSPAIILCPVN